MLQMLESGLGAFLILAVGLGLATRAFLLGMIYYYLL